MSTADNPKKQILVVEDEGLVAADLQNRLKRLGYSVPTVAHSAEEALQCAGSTPFDMVLMDVHLKGRADGIDTAQALRAKFDLPVVYLTAHADQKTIDRAKLTQPGGYLVKPITDGDLRSAVQISIYNNEMERRLRASEAWLSTTLSSVGEGIIATGMNGDVVFMNPVAERLTGWSGAEASGRLLMDVLGLFEESKSRPAAHPVFDLAAGENRTYTLISKAGASTIVEVGWFENRSADTVLGSILVVRDVTARKEMEEQVMQSQRMEAIAQMAGGLTHDFNNQLMIILGYAHQLGQRLSGKDREELLAIEQSVLITSSITSQLLTLSRHEAVNFEILNVNEAIGEVQSLIQHSLGKKLTLAIDLSSPPGHVRCDRNQFKRALLNLAVNARDAMPKTGELRIESSIVEIHAESPAARLLQPGPYVRLRVADTGEGMDPVTLSHIFEPFFTTKKAGHGSGLGLSIVHSILAQSGGSIRATSEIGQGTSFEILLPCFGAFSRIAAGSNGRSAGADPTPTVLLVEDDDNIRRLMHNYLEREGYQMLEARDAEEAELIANEYREPIHLLVSDVVMPGRTGPELANRLAHLRPDMQVLFVTGYPHDALDEHGGQLHGKDVLAKPFAEPELIQRVREALNEAVAGAGRSKELSRHASQTSK